MQEIVDYGHPTRVIMHFAEDELNVAKYGGRLLHYQVTIDPDAVSPDRTFIRFRHGVEQDEDKKFLNEVHGWVEISSVVIDLELEEQVEGTWRTTTKAA
jgi:hypothetical protein